jgi:DNA-binding transcriptional regulator YiaG
VPELTDLTPAMIRARRRQLGLTQAQLAARLSCTTQAVAFSEQGRRTPTGLYAREVRRLLADTEGDDSAAPISPPPPAAPAAR